MRARAPRRRLAACLLSLASLFATAAPAAACSSDYLIWEPRGKNADPLYRFIRDGKAGYIDGAGRVVIEPKLEVYGNYSGVFHDGLLETAVSSGEYVDTTGKRVFKEKLYRGWDFSEGLAAALAENGGKWGYIDRTGKFAISPRFQGYPGGYVSSFSEGRAWVEVSGKYGFIDRTGEFVIQPVLLHAEGFSDGMARVVAEGPCVYHGDGPCPDSRLVGDAERAAGKAPPCKFTFVDLRGSVLGARFDAARNFSEGTAPAMLGGKWGYVDKSGRFVIEPRFEGASGFSGGLAVVMQDGLYGYIDRRGEFVVTPRYKHADDFSEGLAAVGRLEDEDEPGALYYIDRNGRAAIPGPFHVAGHFFKGLAHVELKPLVKRDDDGARVRRFAYINAKGKTVFAYEYEESR